VKPHVVLDTEREYLSFSNLRELMQCEPQEMSELATLSVTWAPTKPRSFPTSCCRRSDPAVRAHRKAHGASDRSVVVLSDDPRRIARVESM